MAKAKSKAAQSQSPKNDSSSKDGAKSARSRAKSQVSPSRAAIVSATFDDLLSPLSQNDAAELFAVKVSGKLQELDPSTAKKFDPYWFRVVIDLATQVINKCTERDVVETLQDVDRRPNGLRARALRRRLARNLPAAAKSQLDESERYELARAAILTGCDCCKDEELWDGLWGRKTGWSPVVRTDETGASGAQGEPCYPPSGTEGSDYDASGQPARY